MKKIMITILLVLVLTACGAGTETAAPNSSIASTIDNTTNTDSALRPVTRNAAEIANAPEDTTTDVKADQTPAVATGEAIEETAVFPGDDLMSQANMEAADIVLIYQRAGGLKGIGPSQYVWTFYADGRITSSDGRSWEVAPEAISNLTGDMKSLGFLELDKNYVPEDTCCDRAFHTISFNDGDQVYTVATLDGADMPESLLNILDDINEYLMSLPTE